MNDGIKIPAQRMYESVGFNVCQRRKNESIDCFSGEYIDTVDLGLGNYGLDWFKLYERVCRNEKPL